jgi:hypothetical protein
MSLEKVYGNGKEARIKRIGNFKLEEAYTMEEDIIEIHKRYGHASFHTLKPVYPHLIHTSPSQCHTCVRDKTKKTFVSCIGWNPYQ